MTTDSHRRLTGNGNASFFCICVACVLMFLKAFGVGLDHIDFFNLSLAFFLLSYII
jgi:hypothetical protein